MVSKWRIINLLCNFFVIVILKVQTFYLQMADYQYAVQIFASRRRRSGFGRL